MTGFKRLVRGAGLGMAGSVSLVLGLLLAERLVRPQVIERIDTPALVGLVLLFVLPVATFLAIRHDRRVVARLRDLAAVGVESHPEPFASASLVAPSPAGPDPRVVRHDAHDRETETADHRNAGLPRPVPTE